MSEQALTTQPSSQPLATRKRSILRVEGRLKRALDLMVWSNQTDSEAAVSTKMNVLSIRMALQKPHVRAYFQAQREVLRQRESPRNIHTLIAVRDQEANQMARVQAVKALEQMEDQPAAAAGRQLAPGIVIVIGSGPADMAHIREIEPKPLIGNKVVPHDE